MKRWLLVALWLLSACGADAAPPAGPPAAGPIDATWVARRVEESRQRMNASEAGTILWRAIESHGGLSRWLAAGTISFEFDYRPRGAPERRMHTVSHVDLWRSRARQEELGDAADATFGFDGERAWIAPGPDAFPTPPRFWATTPFYFVGIPFVLADPGARYERLEDEELDGVTHRIVKVTYDDGTGDSPDDYYVIYVHPETQRVSAIRYIVAYPGFFAEGRHSPEKLMRYDDTREVDGLWLSHRFRTHTWDADAGVIGEVVTDIDAGAYRLGLSWPAAHFAPAPGADVSVDIPAPSR